MYTLTNLGRQTERTRQKLERTTLLQIVLAVRY